MPKLASTILLVAIIISGLAFIGADHLVKAQTATATVPVGSAPYRVAITPNGAYAYVTNGYVTNGVSNTVSVINTATNMVTDTNNWF